MGRCSGCHWVNGGVTFDTSFLRRIYTALLQFLPARAKRNAAGRKRKALLIGINYNHAPDLELSFPQRDMRKMYALLKGEVISQWFGGL